MLKTTKNGYGRTVPIIMIGCITHAAKRPNFHFCS